MQSIEVEIWMVTEHDESKLKILLSPAVVRDCKYLRSLTYIVTYISYFYHHGSTTMRLDGRRSCGSRRTRQIYQSGWRQGSAPIDRCSRLQTATRLKGIDQWMAVWVVTILYVRRNRETASVDCRVDWTVDTRVTASLDWSRCSLWLDWSGDREKQSINVM